VQISRKRPADLIPEVFHILRCVLPGIDQHPDQIDCLRADNICCGTGQLRIPTFAVSDDQLIGPEGFQLSFRIAASGGGIIPLVVVIDPLSGGMNDPAAVSQIPIGEIHILGGPHLIREMKLILPNDIQTIDLVPGKTLETGAEQNAPLAFSTLDQTRLHIRTFGFRDIVRIHIVAQADPVRPELPLKVQK
jgi:hypothetical protein